MSVSNSALSRGTEFCDPHPSSISNYVPEYTSHLNGSRFADMLATKLALTVCGRQKLFCNTGNGVRGKLRWHCGRRGVSVLRHIGSEVHCYFVRCYEEV